MLVICTVVVLLLLAVLHFSTRKQTTATGVPVVGRIPWLGCGVPLDKRGPYFLRECRESIGDVFQIYAGGKALTFCLSPQFLRHFYTATEAELSFFEGISDDKSSFGLVRILGEEPPMAAEEKKELLPLKVLKVYLKDRLPNISEDLLGPAMEEVLDSNLPGAGGEVDLFRLATIAVISMSTRLLVGPRLAANQEYLENWVEFQLSGLEVIKLPELFAKKQSASCKRTREAILAAIEEEMRLQERERMERECLPVIMAKTTFKSTGALYGGRRAAFSVFSFIFATIANTNAAAMMCVVDILASKRITAEVNAAVEALDGFFDSANLTENAHYLDSCLMEALRLYAPPVHIRKAVVDLTMDKAFPGGVEENDIGRVIVPRGEYICISPYLRHRDPDLYEDPEKFLPERNLENSKCVGNSGKFSFLTFGQGRHYCLGKALAELEVKLFICTLFDRYRVSLEKDLCSTQLPVAERKLSWFTFGVVLPKDPVTLRYERK